MRSMDGSSGNSDGNMAAPFGKWSFCSSVQVDLVGLENNEIYAVLGGGQPEVIINEFEKRLKAST